MRGYIVPKEKPQRCARCPYIDVESLDCKLREDASRYKMLTEQYENCPLIEVEIVDVKEAIVPISMIGGYLRRVPE